MRNISSKANHGFLLGSFIFMILLLLTVFIFLMWAFKSLRKQENATGYTERYEFALDSSTLDRALSIYVNDSLIFAGIPSAPVTVTTGRFAEESTLFVVDTESDCVSLFPLPEESITLTLHRNGTEFTAD